MSLPKFSNQYSTDHNRRFEKTLKFMEGIVSMDDKILDLGPENPLSEKMKNASYKVVNTGIEKDLDFHPSFVNEFDYNVLTAFEIFEHLVSPFPILHQTKATKLIASVPLKLWFAKAYWNDSDPYDCHYHEFEPRQFDMLINKAGWEIKKREMWINPSKKIGIRPMLRNITPRHYILYAERIPQNL